jgi:hypothetical protein
MQRDKQAKQGYNACTAALWNTTLSSKACEALMLRAEAGVYLEE